MDPFTRRKLEKKVRAANAEIAGLRQRVAGLRPGPGTFLLIPGADPICLWAGLTWHRESTELLFCVPADDAPFLGSADRRTTDASFPQTLRCGYGTWISQPLLDQATVVGELSKNDCEAALDIVESLLDDRGDEGHPDEDEGLLEWYDELDGIAHEVAELRDRAEEAEEAVGMENVVRFPAPAPQHELVWAASGSTAVWPVKTLAGPEGRKFWLEGGVTDRSSATTTFRCVLVDGAKYPVARFGIELELTDGRVVHSVEREVWDGATVTFVSDALLGPDALKDVRQTAEFA